jgi:hypothetical protein
MIVLNYSPGQTATIFLETTDGYGRKDSDTLPIVTQVFLPNLTLAAGYPNPMIHFSYGLYMAQFTIPTGAASIGSYLIDVSFDNPVGPDGYAQTTQLYQLVVSAPFGQYSGNIIGKVGC